MNVNDVKKYLYKNKEVTAKFSYYKSGNLYYRVEIENSLYEFPISTIEEGAVFNIDEDGGSIYEVHTIVLSSDLGDTPFDGEVKASLLNRWIAKAFETDTFRKIY